MYHTVVTTASPLATETRLSECKISDGLTNDVRLSQRKMLLMLIACVFACVTHTNGFKRRYVKHKCCCMHVNVALIFKIMSCVVYYVECCT